MLVRRCLRALIPAAALLAGALGCQMVPRDQLVQCQAMNRDLYEQNRALLSQAQNSRLHADGLAAQNLSLQQQVAALQGENAALGQRVSVLTSGNSQIQQQYASLLEQLRNQPSPLDAGTTSALEDLARRYPEFEFDPATGVSKFGSDILFDLGRDEVRPQAQNLLREFASILNRGGANDLNILIVGHTDDRRIARPETRAAHPTNWHLSAHRAISVARFLNTAGIDERRMGVAGYGPWQPVVPNTSDENRQRNRRVEIYVLAPNSAVAGRPLQEPY